MNEQSTIASTRLSQLERYLVEDPANLTLLRDASSEALRTGALDRAMELLARMRGVAGEAPSIAHDVALVHFAQGDFAACRTELSPWLQHPIADADASSAVQVLWLRASHHLGDLAEAATWAQEQSALGRLQPAAAGVASLIALDLGDFPQARQFATQAMDAPSPLPEALVARASVAMAERDPATARALLRQALELSPNEGRTWSALGMASLQAQDFPQARVQFARATALMPGHVGTWHGLGWTCLLLQDVPAALAAFHQALALDLNFAESHGAVGLALSLAGRSEEAKPYLLRADRLDRRNVTGRFGRALVSGKLQDRSALRELATRLLDRPGLFGPRMSDEVDI